MLQVTRATPSVEKKDSLSSSLQCLFCARDLLLVTERGKPGRCDICAAHIPSHSPCFQCAQIRFHANHGVFDACSNCSQKEIRFSLERWLQLEDGREWAKEIWFRSTKGRHQMSITDVAWEDIERVKEGSSSGSMIFDVVLKMSNEDIRYVIRPYNLSDIVQKVPVSQISLPLGQVEGKALKAHTLKEVLSDPNLLKQCGVQIEESLYEEEMDDQDGGAAYSVGCALLHEDDVGKSYRVQSFLYPSYQYDGAKYLVLVQTCKGTTASILSMGEISDLSFAQNGKLCEWHVDNYDLSTKEGRLADRTGCNPSTDMMIVFIPVQEKGQKFLLSNHFDHDEIDDDEEESEGLVDYDEPLTLGEPAFIQEGGFGGFPQPMDLSTQDILLGASNSYSNSNSSALNRNGNQSQPKGVKPVKKRGKSSGGFLKVEMRETEKEYVESKGTWQRIKSLGIRVFVRGQLYTRNEPPTREFALRIANYLESKTFDLPSLSIAGYSAQAISRYKILASYQPEAIFDPATFNDDYSKEARLKNEACVICMSEPISEVFLQCGHLCSCKLCARKIGRKCPLCRQMITDIKSEAQVDKSQVHIIPCAVAL